MISVALLEDAHDTPPNAENSSCKLVQVNALQSKIRKGAIDACLFERLLEAVRCLVEKTLRLCCLA